MPFYNWKDVPAEANRPGVTHRRLFGENVQVQQLLVKPGGEPVQLHSHPVTEQFFLIMEGEWEMTVEEEKRRVEPGDVIHVLPGQMHRVRLLSNKPGWLLEIYHPIWSTEIAKQRKQAES